MLQDIRNPYAQGKVYVFTLKETLLARYIEESLQTPSTEIIYLGRQSFSAVSEGDQVVLITDCNMKPPVALTSTGAKVWNINLEAAYIPPKYLELAVLLPHILKGLVHLLPADTPRYNEIMAWADVEK